MKIICEKENLIKALSSVTKGGINKTTMPILEGVLLQTNKNSLKLTTYDLEIGIECITDCIVKEEGNTVVDNKMFNEIIRKLPDTEIKIALNENNLLEIECEGANYKLSTMNPEEFPEIPKIEIEKTIEITQKTLKSIIKKTVFAISTDENKPIFGGCLFETKGDTLNVVAIDGFRLALNKIAIKEIKEQIKIIIPGKTLNEINKIIVDSEEEVKIGIDKNQAIFEIENCKIVTRLIQGEFIEYDNIIPKEKTTRVVANKEMLMKIFERISLISNYSEEKQKKFPVILDISIGKILILCTTEMGNAKEEIYVQTEGQDLEIGFNPKYLLDVFKVIDDQEIYLDFGTSLSPCVIKPINGNEFTYMALPIKLKEA